MVSLFLLYSIRSLSSAFIGLSIFYYFTFIFSYPGWWTKIFFTSLFPSWPTFCLHLHTPPVKLASGPAMSHLKSPSSSLWVPLQTGSIAFPPDQQCLIFDFTLLFPLTSSPDQQHLIFSPDQQHLILDFMLLLPSTSSRNQQCLNSSWTTISPTPLNLLSRPTAPHIPSWSTMSHHCLHHTTTIDLFSWPAAPHFPSWSTMS